MTNETQCRPTGNVNFASSYANAIAFEGVPPHKQNMIILL